MNSDLKASLYELFITGAKVIFIFLYFVRLKDDKTKVIHNKAVIVVTSPFEHSGAERVRASLNKS